MNALILSIVRGPSAGAMNGLHLFFSLGALSSPFLVGRLVAGGLGWELVLGATGLVALATGIVLATLRPPSGRHTGAVPSNEDRSGVGGSSVGRSSAGSAARMSSLPLIALAAAIAAYVASEIGVSSWLVRFLASASLETATTALAIYWGGLAIGRIVSIRVADRLPPVPFAAGCSVAMGIAVLGAVLAPNVGLSIVLFGLAGIASGPVYPMIMAIAGVLYPNRLAAVTGTLAASAVVGGLTYPPLMGVLSESVGIGIGMAGAAALGLACAVALATAGRVVRRSRPVS
jgi:fucose permease